VLLSIGAAVAALLVGGCASSLVSHGRIRTDRWHTTVERVERVRGLQLERDVAARVVSRDALAEVATRAIAEQWRPGELERYVDGLTAAGLWPPGRDYIAAYAAIIGEGGAGLYVPSERALYLVGEGRLPLSALFTTAVHRRDVGRETALAHEIVHALQHQAYPDLIWMAERVHDNDDLQLAVLAALEGDAVRYSYDAAEGPGLRPAPVDLARELVEMARREPMSEAPTLLREVVVASYALGYRLATLEASLLLDSPPASSEQLLHLDRRNERFIATSFEAFHDSLPAGCEFVHENSVGEIGIRVLMRRGAEDDAVAVADGWNGDRYLAARCDGRPALLWITRWDDERDAEQFEAAYRRIVVRIDGLLADSAAAAGERQGLIVRRHGVEVSIASAGMQPLLERAATARQAIVATVDEVADFYGFALPDSLDVPSVVRKTNAGLLSSPRQGSRPRLPARGRRPSGAGVSPETPRETDASGAACNTKDGGEAR
jgi:hypothetical protein